MPIVAKQIDAGSTLEQIRQQFNNLQSDVETLQAVLHMGLRLFLKVRQMMILKPLLLLRIQLLIGRFIFLI